MSPQENGFSGRPDSVLALRSEGRRAWARFQIGRRWRQHRVEIQKGDFDRRENIVRAFDGNNRKSGGRGRGQTAERAATVIGDLARRVVFVRAAFRHMAGTDDLIRRQRGHRHIAAGQAIGETLQRKSRTASMAMAPAELLSCMILRMNPMGSECHICGEMSPRHNDGRGETTGIASVRNDPDNARDVYAACCIWRLS